MKDGLILQNMLEKLKNNVLKNINIYPLLWRKIKSNILKDKKKIKKKLLNKNKKNKKFHEFI